MTLRHRREHNDGVETRFVKDTGGHEPTGPGASDQPDRREAGNRGLTRRQFLPRAAGSVAALAAAGAAGFELSQQTATSVSNPYAEIALQRQDTNAKLGPPPGTAASGIQQFVTRPDLTPPLITVTELDRDGTVAPAPRFVLVTPLPNIQFKYLQRGPMLIDRRGRLVWFEPVAHSALDANVQSYRGEPRLTWWQGKIIDGHGVGTAVVADSSYHTIATVPSTASRPIDMHEFNTTPNGTVLLTSYQPAHADLTAIGGSSNGPVLAGHALEIDAATGKVLFDWNSLDHVEIGESYEPLDHDKPYDYFHINSIALANDGNLLISGRNTFCVYKVHRHTGRVIWRLNGKRSGFHVPDAAAFSWQHHVRQHPDSTFTIFNNANNSAGGSSALHLNVHERERRVSLIHAYRDPGGFVSNAMGSAQLLDGGRMFVCWGKQQYFSEFADGGRMRMTAQFDGSMRSYRGFAVDWVGHPANPPAVAATQNPAGGFIVYTSWNGATEINRWDVLAGTDADQLKAVGSRPWCGFETAIAINSDGPLFQVIARDRGGKELDRSRII